MGLWVFSFYFCLIFSPVLKRKRGVGKIGFTSGRLSDFHTNFYDVKLIYLLQK